MAAQNSNHEQSHVLVLDKKMNTLSIAVAKAEIESEKETSTGNVETNVTVDHTNESSESLQQTISTELNSINITLRKKKEPKWYV
jgi:hypothetical protein